MNFLIVDDFRDIGEVIERTSYDNGSIYGFDPEKDCVIIARTYSAAISILQSGIHFDCIFLDHDLGGQKTGYDIVCHIERYARTGSSLDFVQIPNDLICISANPVGRDKIIKTWEGICKHLESLDV